MANNNPTDILRKEHDKVLNVLDKLEKNLEDKDLSQIKQNIKILEEEFSRHSLDKEEKALFPEIEKFIPREGGPTGMMIIEHEEIIGLIKKFKEGMAAKDFRRMSDAGNSIFSILRPHIDKENNMLFMMADMHLDDRQKKAILEKFKKIDLKS